MSDSRQDLDSLTVSETSDVMKVHDETIRRWIRDGRLPAFRVGGAYRIPRVAIERLISEAVGGER